MNTSITSIFGSAVNDINSDDNNKNVLLNAYMNGISSLIRYTRQGDIIAAALIEYELCNINRELDTYYNRDVSGYTADLV
jgi:hypothetical protein